MPLSLFSITVKEYKSIRFDAADASFLQYMIWGICIGAVLASLLSLYQQNVPGKLVRALLRAEAHTKETAKTLEELGLAGKPLIARELRKGTALKKFVQSAENEEGKGNDSQSAENTVEGTENAPTDATDGTKAAPTRYYIPANLKYRANTRYEKKGSSVLSLALTALLSVTMAVLLFKLIPLVLSMIDSIL